ncbi:hypothetical protein TNIN_190081 [Trichonephila inaurata madagascariensis]|uniref:Uncharacterized protein n=1 Tax=Trichonephila inaurata madagascariensis TaxID=2747483 RepID=A0A8X6IBQ3_9ARAC|nr:hypothetical protein TNIN_190081 [Trichonephila inaurata madagascariensis]
MLSVVLIKELRKTNLDISKLQKKQRGEFKRRKRKNTNLSFRHMSIERTQNREDRLRPLSGKTTLPLTDWLFEVQLSSQSIVSDGPLDFKFSLWTYGEMKD